MSTLYGDNIFESNINFLYRSVMESDILFEEFDISINESVGEKIKQTIETIIKKVKEFFTWIKKSVQSFFRGLKKGLNSDIKKKTEEVKREVKDPEKKKELDSFFKEYAPVAFEIKNNAKRFSSMVRMNLRTDNSEEPYATAVEVDEVDGKSYYYTKTVHIASMYNNYNYKSEDGINLFTIYNENGHCTNETFALGYLDWIDDLSDYINEIAKMETDFNKEIEKLKKSAESDYDKIKIDLPCRSLVFTIRHLQILSKDCTITAKKINDYATKYNYKISQFLNNRNKED